MSSFERHKRRGINNIVTDFGKHLLWNWLSRTGYIASIINNTEINLIAYHPDTHKRLGIIVKTAIRTEITLDSPVAILNLAGKISDREKLLNACNGFKVEPWIAIFIETESYAELYLTSLEHYDKLYNTNPKSQEIWPMSAKHRVLYEDDIDVKYLRLDFSERNWGN